MKKNQAAGGLRTAGSDKHNQPKQYGAYGRVAHARRMGGSIVTIGSVHAVCYVPVICLGSVLTARESLREKQTTFDRYVRTWYKIRPRLLKPGKSSYPLPAPIFLSACHALHSARLRRDLDQCIRTGFPCRDTWKKYEHTCTYTSVLFSTTTMYNNKIRGCQGMAGEKTRFSMRRIESNFDKSKYSSTAVSNTSVVSIRYPTLNNVLSSSSARAVVASRWSSQYRDFATHPGSRNPTADVHRLGSGQLHGARGGRASRCHA